MEIQIHHTGTQDGSAIFEVIRSLDMKHTAAVPLPEPAIFPVEGHPVKNLLPKLRWYLEDYLQEPFGVFPQLAESVAETMRAWGTAVFDALFIGYARDWYQDAKRNNFEDFHIKIASDSPEIMSWPWEALYSKDDGYLALRCCIDRQLSNISDPPPLPAVLAQDALHILYIIPRPYGENDVGYQVLANSLVTFVRENDLPVTVDVLRPPTFSQLQKVLYDRPGYYHIVHFDGHGGYGAVTSTSAGNLYAAPKGQLVFETDDDEPDPIDTRRLAQLLAEYNIPVMVMNACQSGMIDGQAQDPFASVAAGLLKAGIRSVVAMGYSLYVSGAKEFIPAFYERLFSAGKVSEAMRAGRKKMMERPMRDCIVGKLPLQDWVVPVLYQQLSAESTVLPNLSLGKKVCDESFPLPKNAEVDGDYGFIGRGCDIQKLERALQRQKQAAILIHGQAGIGKTSLTKGGLRWLQNTGGLRGRVFWFDFEEIHSVEYIMNQMIGELMGTSDMAKNGAEKLSALVQYLRGTPCLLVWDNFESASGIEGTEIQPQLSGEDRDLLAQMLKGLRGGKTKILITSRSKETWLPVQSCYRLPLDGLVGEDLWEYCNAVVRDLGLTFDRNDETYIEILHKLCGNPLAIRAILLRLQDCSAEQLLAELESTFNGMEGDEGTRRLQAAYTVFGESLTSRFLPILQLTGLHEYYLDADLVREMLRVVECSTAPDDVNSCYHILENAGFCTHIGQNIYRLHPALRGYLLRETPALIPIQKSFVDIMGSLANSFIGKPLHEIVFFYQTNTANFYYARYLAEICQMDINYIALTQSLAYYAQMMRRYEEAVKLYTSLVEKTQSLNYLTDIAGAFHQLGIISEERRDFAAAETWYRKSLAIAEKQGNEHIASITSHQLGRIAQERRDFATAEFWYKKSLAITEKRENKHAIASTYHQLGRIAQEQRNFTAAESWFKKSLAIFEQQGNEKGIAINYHQLGKIAQKQQTLAVAESWTKKAMKIFEKQGNEHDAADTYHELGIIAVKQRDFVVAESWAKKSLEIFERQGDEHSSAINYYQLGMIAEGQRDFAAAESWTKKALAVFQKQGNEYHMACAYHQLGIIAQKRWDFPGAADFYLKSLKIFADANDPHSLMVVTHSYARLLHNATDTERILLRKIWSMCMDKELTEILEQMEAKLYGTNS